MSCVVRHCSSRWKPKSDIKFHSFPKDPKRRRQWLIMMPLKGKFYESAKICSLHFKAKDYDPENPERLIKSAFPSYMPQDCSCDATEACCCLTGKNQKIQNADVNFVKIMKAEQAEANRGQHSKESESLLLKRLLMKSPAISSPSSKSTNHAAIQRSPRSTVNINKMDSGHYAKRPLRARSSRSSRRIDHTAIQHSPRSTVYIDETDSDLEGPLPAISSPSSKSTNHNAIQHSPRSTVNINKMDSRHYAKRPLRARSSRSSRRIDHTAIQHSPRSTVYIDETDSDLEELLPASSIPRSKNTNHTAIQRLSRCTVNINKMDFGHYAKRPLRASSSRSSRSSDHTYSPRSTGDIDETDSDLEGPLPASSSRSSRNTNHTAIQRSSRSTVNINKKCSGHYAKRPVPVDEEPPTKRPCLRNVKIQVKMKSAREIKLKKSIKLLRQTVTRQKRKIEDMSNIIDMVKKYTSQSAMENILNGNYASICKALKQKPTKGHVEYSAEVKAFASTLHSHSPTAYEFLRKIISLPHKTTLWRSIGNQEIEYIVDEEMETIADQEMEMIVDQEIEIDYD